MTAHLPRAKAQDPPARINVAPGVTAVKRNIQTSEMQKQHTQFGFAPSHRSSLPDCRAPGLLQATEESNVASAESRAASHEFDKQMPANTPHAHDPQAERWMWLGADGRLCCAT